LENQLLDLILETTRPAASPSALIKHLNSELETLPKVEIENLIDIFRIIADHQS